MKKIIKKTIIAMIAILFLAMAMYEPEEPKGDMTPYMSDVVMMPQKTYAKGKPQKSKIHKIEVENLGEFTLTAYCPCCKCCGNNKGITATGTKAKAGRTIAVDPKKIAYGSKIIINGHEYIAEDCGGAVKGNHIDIFFNSHDEALEFGKQTATVYKRKPPKLVTKIKRLGVSTWAQKKYLKIKLKTTLKVLAVGKSSSLPIE